MTTGTAWDLSSPERPWANFDPDAIRDIPIEIGDWLSSMGTTYASHQVIADAPLHCSASSHSAGVIVVRMNLAPSAVYIPGTKYPFTVRVVGADGQLDDRTLWLRLKNR